MRVAVIPALDEERALGSVVLRAAQHVDRVLVVDDGSRDRTAEVALLAGAEVVRHARNQGKGAALRTGLRAAVERGADLLVLLDGDGQHDPDFIPAVLAPLARGEADLVVGARTLPGEGAPTRARRAGRGLLDGATRAVAGGTVHDTQSGYRAMTAKAAELLLPREDGMGVESEMLVRAREAGLRVAEVPVPEHYPADVRGHVAPSRQAASVVGALLREVRERHPLLVLGVPGLALLAFGFAEGWLTATHYYATQEFWAGKALLAVLGLVLGSQALFAALLLDFVGLKLGRTLGR